jgi:hypothetical protein
LLLLLLFIIITIIFIIMIIQVKLGQTCLSNTSNVSLKIIYKRQIITKIQFNILDLKIQILSSH